LAFDIKCISEHSNVGESIYYHCLGIGHILWNDSLMIVRALCDLKRFNQCPMLGIIAMAASFQDAGYFTCQSYPDVWINTN
jgi:hypothetical protein